jgi:hypothetical protein
MNFKNLIYIVLAGLVVVSCNKEPLPWEVFEDMEKGAFARVLENDGASFFLTDFNNSSTTFTVELYDENRGNNIASFDWYVRHRNKVAGTTSNPALLVAKSSSEFSPNAKSGLPSATYTLKLTDAAAALGLTADDFNGGDDVIFDGIITMNDGRTFGPDNTGAAVAGGAGFDGFFRTVKSLLCTSELAGVFDASTVAAGPWGCTNPWEGTLEWVSVGDGEYEIIATDADHPDGVVDMSSGAYWPCYGAGATTPTDGGDGELVIIDACNNLSWKGASRWGEIYSFNSITVDGASLTYDWVNDYGEGGVTTVTRTDGSVWPPLKI